VTRRANPQPIPCALAVLLFACASPPAPALTPVGAVTSSLRAVAAAQEKHYTDHGTYSTNLEALRRYPGCVIQPGVTITFHEGSTRGWAGSGFHRGFPDRSCVQWVSRPDGVPVPLTLLEQRRADEVPGGVVCDAPLQ
jgi:hypothetical protein